MNWIYELAESILGISHDWAAILALFISWFVFILMLVTFEPWLRGPVEWLTGGKIKNPFPRDSVVFSSANGFIEYWHRWGSKHLSKRQVVLQKKLLDAGVDWILETCITHNILRVSKAKLIRFEYTDIERVVAAWAGYINGLRKWSIYRWILELQDGEFIYLRGWFDPSRHEERTSLFAWEAESAIEAAQIEIQPERLWRKERREKGHDKLMDQEVHQALLDQIKSGERDWAGFKCGTEFSV